MLGRNGQAVQRGRTASNYREARSDAGPRSGSKRSLGYGLRIYSRGSFVSTKRRRGDGTYWNAHVDRVNETGLTPNDLRLKLLRRRRKIGYMNNSGRFQPRPEVRERFHLKQKSYTQNACHIHMGNSMQKHNSSRILNEVGARSSDILLKSSIAVAPPRNYDGQQRFSSINTTVSTARSLARNGVFYEHKGTIENAKPVRQLASMSGTGEKISQGVAHLTVCGLLHSLGLGKYEIAFRAEEIDMTVLKQLREKDLKDLGIPMGPRKKILLSLRPPSKQQPPRVRNLI